MVIDRVVSRMPQQPEPVYRGNVVRAIQRRVIPPAAKNLRIMKAERVIRREKFSKEIFQRDGPRAGHLEGSPRVLRVDVSENNYAVITAEIGSRVPRADGRTLSVFQTKTRGVTRSPGSPRFFPA